MALFIDTFVNRIDKKGRVSVPATFRAALIGLPFSGIVGMPHFRYDAVQCAGIDWMEGLVAQMGNVDLFSDEHDDLSATLFSDAKQLAFDGEGRVVLPDLLVAHAHLAEEVGTAQGKGDAGVFWQAAQDLTEAINTHLLNPETGLYYLNIDLDGSFTIQNA